MTHSVQTLNPERKVVQGCHEDWCDAAFVARAFVTAVCVTEATVSAVAHVTATAVTRGAAA